MIGIPTGKILSYDTYKEAQSIGVEKKETIMIMLTCVCRMKQLFPGQRCLMIMEFI